MHREPRQTPQLPDPLTFTLTISEFKFHPRPFRSLVPSRTHTASPCLANPELTKECFTQQIPRRGLSFRSDRDKKLQRLSCKRVAQAQEVQTGSKAHMFKTCKERGHSSTKTLRPVDKLMLVPRQTAEREWSSSHKRISALKYALDLDRNRLQTTTRVKGHSPMELLTQKLQWREREVKRSKPLLQPPRIMQEYSKAPGHEGIFLAHLQGWEAEDRESHPFLPGDRGL